MLAKKHSGNLVILCLGPLTNLAFAYKLDPTLPHHLKQVLSCGGAHHYFGTAGYGTEFNYFCDPESAHLFIRKFKTPLILPIETSSNFWVNQKFISALQEGTS